MLETLSTSDSLLPTSKLHKSQKADLRGKFPIWHYVLWGDFSTKIFYNRHYHQDKPYSEQWLQQNTPLFEYLGRQLKFISPEGYMKLTARPWILCSGCHHIWKPVANILSVLPKSHTTGGRNRVPAHRPQYKKVTSNAAEGLIVHKRPSRYHRKLRKIVHLLCQVSTKRYANGGLMCRPWRCGCYQQSRKWPWWKLPQNEWRLSSSR